MRRLSHSGQIAPDRTRQVSAHLRRFLAQSSASDAKTLLQKGFQPCHLRLDFVPVLHALTLCCIRSQEKHECSVSFLSRQPNVSLRLELGPALH